MRAALPAAVRRLTYPLEKLFLRHVGRQTLKNRHRNTASARPRAQDPRRQGKAEGATHQSKDKATSRRAFAKPRRTKR